MQDQLAKLQKKINLKFKNINTLKKAITHKSYDSNNNYEQFEFLGDRILGFVISKKIIELFKTKKEGFLDKKLASLVNKNKCLEVAKKINLEKFILVGNKKNKIKNNIESKILSDSVEALIGAIFFDKGFQVAEKFILDNWKNYFKSSDTMILDSKTKLQEISLKNFKILPTYKFISSAGPKHKPTFIIAVKLKNTKFYSGKGNSKQMAEQDAATNLLNNLKL